MSTSGTNLSTAQRDRAAGVLLGAAVGDALASGRASGPLTWTANTAAAVAIAEIASSGADLRQQSSLDYIAERWCRMGRTGTHTAPGNSALVRAAPIALSGLGDLTSLTTAVHAVTALTHQDAESAEACVLWCGAIRHAVLSGTLDARIGMGQLDPQRQVVWERRLTQAEEAAMTVFAADNGGVVAALQAAWSVIANTAVPEQNPHAGSFRSDHLRTVIEAAAQVGGDSAAVASIAGALVGGAYGASAVPWQWRVGLRGWPGLNSRGLVHLAERITDRGRPGPLDRTYAAWQGYPAPVRHPHDAQLWLGAAASLRTPRAGVDAVVSLCRIADGDIPADVIHLDVRLDEETEADPDFVLVDTVRALEALRADGRTVFLHGLRATSRTPAVAALYGARRSGTDIESSLDDVVATLPQAEPSARLVAALHRVHPVGAPDAGAR